MIKSTTAKLFMLCNVSKRGNKIYEMAYHIFKNIKQIFKLICKLGLGDIKLDAKNGR
jgi:hypothetical protein